MGFLLSRRWVLFACAVVVLALGSVRLGEWQFDRLHDREQRNTWFSANIDADPVPGDRIMAVDRPLDVQDEWRRVSFRGRYDAAQTVVVRYQTRDGQSGIDLVTPLVTDVGAAVLVDRGWLATKNTGTTPDDVPAPPPGEVDVTGWVRSDGEGSSTVVEDRSTRAISSRAIGADLEYPVYRGFVDAEIESPSPSTALVPAELPDLGEGPHLFYGIQWWFFGALAVFGFGYLAYDERRKARRPENASAGDRVR